MQTLRQQLYAWRDAEAAKRGVELFRVLPNNALDEIVRSSPRTKEELTAIKGIKEAKYREFGKAILAMVDEHTSHQPAHPKSDAGGSSVGDLPIQGVTLDSPETSFSVSTYLDIVNRELYRLRARVVGEVTSIKLQGSAAYIGLKDTKDESALSVFMWQRDYVLSGIEITEGMEVAVEGRGDIYKPNGRFSFRAETIALVGEGALKKAYDALKKKLEEEGVFAPERKRALPEYPERIGLVTSKTGAVIHDFLTNLGKFGFKVKFTDSRVEGVAAVKDILGAIKYFSTQDVDALVVIRGGGSLESLQAFNNERVVRAIAEFPRPVICAIGHDKDVPLAQLAADHAPSTPTAATALLNRSWEEGIHTVRYFTKDITGLYQEELWANKDLLRTREESVRAAFAEITLRFSGASREFSDTILLLGRWFARLGETLEHGTLGMLAGYKHLIESATREVGESSRLLQFHNPLRQLRLGYSILSKGGKVVRSAKELPAGTHFEVRLSDGMIEAKSVPGP